MKMNLGFYESSVRFRQLAIIFLHSLQINSCSSLRRRAKLKISLKLDSLNNRQGSSLRGRSRCFRSHRSRGIRDTPWSCWEDGCLTKLRHGFPPRLWNAVRSWWKSSRWRIPGCGNGNRYALFFYIIGESSGRVLWILQINFCALGRVLAVNFFGISSLVAKCLIRGCIFSYLFVRNERHVYIEPNHENLISVPHRQGVGSLIFIYLHRVGKMPQEVYFNHLLVERSKDNIVRLNMLAVILQPFQQHCAHFILQIEQDSFVSEVSICTRAI